MTDDEDLTKTWLEAQALVREHVASVDPEGLALRCSCGGWAMLYLNSLEHSAEAAHHRHVAKFVHPTPPTAHYGGVDPSATVETGPAL